MNITDALGGVTFNGEPLPDGALISDVVLVARYVNADTGHPNTVVMVTDGTDWPTHLGLSAVLALSNAREWNRDQEDE